ncbi:MAG TPA: sn-glycerol-3-phosphate ABC transporter ATP-binding protein UgpC [Chloroflexota bacterium]|nr:sn-glycerol-3-phosphate ABC transporter ATP-binding protein UgpC [Chloroflexota bacterium]
MAAVHLEQVTKVFSDRRRGQVVAVDGVTLTVPDGTFVVLVGPSGCGKTTTLRLVAGLERQTRGDIFIGERLVNKLHPKERDIAMVFQDYALYPHMTVYENLTFGLRNLRVPRAQIERQVQQAAEMLGLGHLLQRRPRELSGGQRQRVAVGRAIVRSPQVFLFDEPLSNLDAQLRVQMRVDLAELHKRLGVTTIYVTHDQVEAMTLGQQIVVMHGGVIQQIDDPRTLYDRPANLFVARFIGAPPMNLFEGRLQLDHGAKFVGQDFAIDLPAGVAGQYGGGGDRRLVLGIRPEDITLADDASRPPGLPVGRLTGHVRVVEYLGSEMLLYFGLGGKTYTARMPPQTVVQHDGEVRLQFGVDRAAFFDPQTEQRIPAAAVPARPAAVLGA